MLVPFFSGVLTTLLLMLLTYLYIHNKCFVPEFYTSETGKIVLSFYGTPCKAEDFKNLADSVTKENEALFLRHGNSRWLVLSRSLALVLKQWTDCKTYFLEYVPAQKEYRYTLPKNKRYIRIKKCLQEDEKVCSV